MHATEQFNGPAIAETFDQRTAREIREQYWPEQRHVHGHQLPPGLEGRDLERAIFEYLFGEIGRRFPDLSRRERREWARQGVKRTLAEAGRLKGQAR